MQTNETHNSEIKTAHDLYTHLGIQEPFKNWIAKQPDFATFKPFFRRLPSGALGKDYKLTLEQCEGILKYHKPQKKAAKAPKRPKLQPLPGVELTDGYYSIEAYMQAVFGTVYPDKRAKRIGISLSARAHQKKITLEKTPHPVWKEVNCYPKAMLDKFFGPGSKKANFG